MSLTRFLILLISLTGLLSCSGGEDYSLDSAIPRLQSPADQIAYTRTKWIDGQHVETTFYDHQNRILETFNFGRSSSKVFNKYENNLLTTTISYSHSDSSEPGYLSIDTLHRKYDAHGRLAMELHVYGIASKSINVDTTGHYKRILDYTASGDTIIKHLESSFQQDTSQTTDISQWEHDDKRRVIRFYRLYVLKGNRDSRPDTSMHFSKRFAYDKHGRLKMAWFDSMYLGNSYMVSGPDTTLYRYDSQNRLVEEKQRYTTSLHNKREMDTTGLSLSEKKALQWHKDQFYTGSPFQPKNVSYIKYHYEKFDHTKHQTLAIPQPN